MIEGPSRAALADFQRIVEVSDTCFPRDKERGGMLARWPHVYLKTSAAMGNYLVMRDGGAIVAQAGYTNESLHIEGKAMRVACVTAVATVPEWRGRGLMTSLMNSLNRQMLDEGYVFAELGGRRIRYNHFGYDNATRDVRFGMRAATLNAVGAPPRHDVVRYEGDEALARATFEIHAREPFGLDRDLAKHKVLLGRHGWETFVALADGKARSYLTVIREKEGAECRVFEFGGEQEGVHALLAHQTLALNAQDVRIETPVGHPLNRFFYTACDGWSIVAKRMVRILDLPAMLDGFGGQMRARYRQAGYGGGAEFSLGMDGTDQSATVRISPDNVSVTRNRGAPQIRLPELEMVRFLFGMEGPNATVAVPSGQGFLRAILPLDYYVWSLEMA